MNYYILDEIPGRWDISYISELPEELDIVLIAMGRKPSIKNLPVRLPVTFDSDPESEIMYPDIMTADVPLFSEKLKQAIIKIGIDAINFYPVELFNEESGQTVAHYYMAIVLEVIKCLKSGIEKTSAGREILKNPVIDPAKVANHKVFRLGESPSLIIINSDIKKELLDAELQGVSIVKLQDYVGI